MRIGIIRKNFSILLPYFETSELSKVRPSSQVHNDGDRENIDDCPQVFIQVVKKALDISKKF